MKVSANDYWVVTKEEVERRFAGKADDFEQFMLELLYLYAVEAGMMFREINASSSTSSPDYGVDASVKSASPHMQPRLYAASPFAGSLSGYAAALSGWFSVPTIWQFKSSSTPSLAEVVNEIKKSAASNDPLWRQLADGCGYRLCVCLPLIAVRSKGGKKGKPNWEAELQAVMAPSTPEVMVLDAGDLAAWASRYPAMQQRFFGRETGGSHFEAWRRQVQAVTREFVPVADRDAALQMISDHLDLSKPAPASIVLTLRGESGVGKSRLVYEAVASDFSHRTLVIYFDAGVDEGSLWNTAKVLHNDGKLRAVLVADDCSAVMRSKLQQLLASDGGRLRVVATDSELGEASASAVSNDILRLKRMTTKEVEAILKTNFKGVAPSLLSRSIDWSGGFIQFAADMCKHDDAALEQIEGYLDARLSPQDWNVVELLSLGTRVGFKDELAHELELLCSLVGWNHADFINHAQRLRASGLVAQAGRFYVVPVKAVFNVAFKRAWSRLLEPRLEQVLATLDEKAPMLLQSILKRAAVTGTPSTRAAIGSLFGGDTEQIDAEYLQSSNFINLFVLLARVHPDFYLPMLHRLIEQATPEQLPGQGLSRQRWTIIWLLERFAYEPRFFGIVEEMLLKLAVDETEHTSSNNASDYWQQLFRIALSGTNTPFLDRLPVLEQRIFSRDKRTVALAFAALDKVMDSHYSRVAVYADGSSGETLQDWRPNINQYRAGKDAVVELLGRLLDSGDQGLYERTLELVLEHSYSFIYEGSLDQLKRLLHNQSLSDTQRVKLHSRVGMYVRRHKEERVEDESERSSDEYRNFVREWLDELEPTDLHSRLVRAVSAHWVRDGYFEDEQEWESEVRNLSTLLLDEGNLLAELSWLHSAQAGGAWLLGRQVGEQDTTTQFLPLIVDASKQHDSVRFTSGYLYAIRSHSPQAEPDIQQRLELLQQSQPEAVIQLSFNIEAFDETIARAEQLVHAGQLSADYLMKYSFRISDDVNLAEFRRLLKLLLWQPEGKEPEVSQTTYVADLISQRLYHEERHPSATSILDDEWVLAWTWQLAETEAWFSVVDDYCLPYVYKALSSKDLPRAAYAGAVYTAVKGGMDDSMSHILLDMAGQDGTVVMEQLGAVMLDDKYRLAFGLHIYRSLFAGLGVETVSAWVQRIGVEAARKLARHVPPPFIGAEEKPMLHPLTEFLLREYGHDEDVLSAFHAGFGTTTSMLLGDWSHYHHEQAALAKKFLRYPLPAVQMWAWSEYNYHLAEAARAKQQEQEERLEWGG